ncbi:MAG: hypothetical protein AAF648_01615 [Pseudomonadota bacterium]
MNMMAELSLYPLRDDFVEPVDALLTLLNAEPGLEITTNRMSTLVFGEQTLVLKTIDRALRELTEGYGKVSLVCKFLPDAERTFNGYR